MQVSMGESVFALTFRILALSPSRGVVLGSIIGERRYAARVGRNSMERK